MKKRYVVSLDEGTTSARAVLIDAQGKVAGSAQRVFPQHYPHPGWVEHSPRDILSAQLGALTELLVSRGLGSDDLDSLGITNQRETTVVWNRETGDPVCNAIVWQCRRTAPLIDSLCGDPDVARAVTAKTGLVPDAYFSASKIRWILDSVPGVRRDAEAGKTRVRYHRLVADMGAHGRCGARDRRDEREPHPAVRHTRHALGSVVVRAVRRADEHAARGAALIGGLRRDGRVGGRCRRCSHLRRCGRPAIGAVRPVLL